MYASIPALNPLSIPAPRSMRIQAAVSAPAAPVGSLYEVLRVKRTASQTEIKTAYRTLAKLYHPDCAPVTHQDDGLDFVDIHNAYETLSDPASRTMYDLSLGVARMRRRRTPSACYRTTRRRWETDQCW